jgi:hypothetical protein
VIYQAEKVRRPVSENVAEALDRALSAGGELVGLRQRAWLDQQSTRAGVPVAGVAEEASADPVTATLAAVAAFAADVSRRITDGNPPAMKLDELEADIDEIAVRYTSTPHAVLAPQIADRWRQVEAALDRRATLAARKRLTLLAGQYSYFMSRIAFNVGDMRSSRRLCVLAEQHSADVGEPILAASIAAIRSGIDYWTGRYGSALNHLLHCPEATHPYMAARMAAYTARTWAMLGDRQAAAEALDRMDAAAGQFRPLPGDTPVSDAAVAMFRGGISAQLGEGDEAMRWAPLAIAAYSRRGPDFSVEEAMHARANLAMAHLLSRQPDVDGAAAEGMALLAELQSSPTHTVQAKIGRVIGAFTSAQRQSAPARTFIDAARVLALPAGTGR